MSTRTNYFNLGSARASRAGDRALAIANFPGPYSPNAKAFAGRSRREYLHTCRLVSESFGEGLETCTRGACAPRNFRLLRQGKIANTRAGKPDPPFGLGKLTTTIAPASGT
jgi:hypothetical protein